MSGVFLFDRKQNLFKAVDSDDIIENYQEIEINNLIKATLVLKYKKDFEEAYYFGVKEENDFWLYSIRNYIKEDNKLSLQGIHIMFDELKGVLVKDLRPTNKMAGPALNAALTDSTWTAISSATNKASTSLYYISALDSLYKICKEWNLEFKPVLKFVDGKIKSKEIHLTYNQGRDYGKVFSYGDNLVSVVAETSKDELFTAFVGRGKGEEITDDKGNPTGGYGRKITFEDIDYKDEKDGIKVHSPKGVSYIEIEEATDLYGYPDGRPRITSVDFENIEDKEKLARATFEYALKNCRPKIQLKATGYQQEPVALGEVVTIIADMGIRYKTRVFKIKKDYISQNIVSFEFGDKVAFSLSSRLKAADLEKKDEEVKQLSYIESILQAIESSYFNDDGYQYDLKVDNKYKLPAGFYSFNKPIDKNPTKVIYLGAGKLMIANGKKPNGQWDFRVALDGDSVNAEVIRAGILKGGKVFWNLEDGTFLIGNSKEDYHMYWDGQTLHLRNVDIDLKNQLDFKNLKYDLEKMLDESGESYASQLKELEQTFTMKNGEIESKIKGVRDGVEATETDIKKFVSENYTTLTQTDELIRATTTNVKTMVDGTKETLEARMDMVDSNVSIWTSKVEKNIKDELESNYANLNVLGDKIETAVMNNNLKLTEDMKQYMEATYAKTTQTSDMIKTEVSKQVPDISGIENQAKEALSVAKQTAEEISTKVSKGELQSEISQTNDRIATKVGKLDVLSIIEQLPDYVQIKAKNIDLKGDVSVVGEFKTSSYGKRVEVVGSKINFFDGYVTKLGSIGVNDDGSVEIIGPNGSTGSIVVNKYADFDYLNFSSSQLNAFLNGTWGVIDLNAFGIVAKHIGVDQTLKVYGDIYLGDTIKVSRYYGQQLQFKNESYGNTFVIDFLNNKTFWV